MVTPIQLVRMIGAVASGGDSGPAAPVEKFHRRRPSISRSPTTPSSKSPRECGESSTRAALERAETCRISTSPARSGTAQSMSYEAGSKTRQEREGNQRLVRGLAPRRNPEIVVAAVVQGSSEHGERTAAAPVVRDIVKAYYDKKNGKKDLRTYTAKDGTARRSCRLRWKRSDRLSQDAAQPVKSDAKERQVSAITTGGCWPRPSPSAASACWKSGPRRMPAISRECTRIRWNGSAWDLC